MEFMFDTANISEIAKYIEIYPTTGITTNPSILKAEGRIELFSHMKKIRAIIGENRSLHIQVIAKDFDGIMKEAETIISKTSEKTYIKVPTTEDGLKAIRLLKAKGVNVTATAIYSKIQGFMAIANGADFIAPYYNRMENMNIDSNNIIADLRKVIDRTNSKTKILAASFKNIAQVNQAILAGAHVVTIQPSMLHDIFETAALKKAVDDFQVDWRDIQGKDTF